MGHRRKRETAMQADALSVPIVPRARGCCASIAPLLPAERAAALSLLGKAVADPARIQILHLLTAAATPVCVCDFTAALDLTQPTVSHHLARLKEAGLVSCEKYGVWSFYRLRDDLSSDAQTLLSVIRQSAAAAEEPTVA